MTTRDDLAGLLGRRVRATVVLERSPTDVTGVLRFLPPDGTMIVTDPAGHEAQYPLDAVVQVDDARYDCAKCGAKTNTSFDPREQHPDYDGPTPLCADDYRSFAYAQPPPIMPCPECNTGARAFFSPGDKTFACPQCHMKRGGMTGLAVEARVLKATCRSANIDSPDHDWKQVRGQWLCRSCHVKVRTKPAHADQAW